MMNFFGAIVNLDFLGLMPLGCVMNKNFHHQLLMQTLLPLVTGILMITLYFTFKRAGNVQRANSTFGWFLFMTFLVLPNVSTKIFTTLACREFDQGYGKFLKADYSIDCTSTEHLLSSIYAVICIFIYPIGIPAMYYVLLKKKKSKIDPGQTRMSKELGSAKAGLAKALEVREDNEEEDPALLSLSFLYSNYTPKNWYFEIVETSRKLMLTGGLLVLGPGTASQIVMR